jgi:hypothetical protein
MALTTETRSAHWQHHVDHWQASGLSGMAYCRQHELVYHCFVYWRSKLTKVSTDPSGKTDAESQAPSAFVAVRSQPLPRSTEVSGDDLHLRLPNGLEIRNIYHSNLDHVRSLLECL